MTLIIDSGYTWDADATAYIEAVETADGQQLEEATRKAIENFVVGCKVDGIWNAIKASCILAGARTLNGALTTLKPASAGGNAAPTRNGTEGGWSYNRKTSGGNIIGLAGNGTNNYLNSGRNNNADPLLSQHISSYVSTAATLGVPESKAIMGAGVTETGSTGLVPTTSGSSSIIARSRSSAAGIFGSNSATGFIGISRSASDNLSARASGLSVTLSLNADPSAFDGNLLIFNRSTSSVYSNARLAFYSIGESLDLALLDARVTALINAFGAAIP